jgi:hypothetical protein
MVMPRGALKVAAIPTPFAPPATPLPASVVTAVVPILTARMRLFSQSATYSTPLLCHTAEEGC